MVKYFAVIIPHHVLSAEFISHIFASFALPPGRLGAMLEQWELWRRLAARWVAQVPRDILGLLRLAGAVAFLEGASFFFLHKIL